MDERSKHSHCSALTARLYAAMIGLSYVYEHAFRGPVVDCTDFSRCDIEHCIIIIYCLLFIHDSLVTDDVRMTANS